MSLANISSVDWGKPGGKIQVAVALTTMLLAGMYPFSYIFSFVKTRHDERISIPSLLPLLHIVLTVLSLIFWGWLNEYYRG